MLGPGPLPPDRRTPVVLVTGFSEVARAQADRVARAALAAKGTVVVHHDLAELAEGVVRRTVRTHTGSTATMLELAHGCVSCTLRADLLPLLVTLAARDSVRRIVLPLDPAFEAEAVCRAIHDTVITGVIGRVDGPAGRDVRIEAVLACVDGARWLGDATGDDTLAERGLATADDDRTVAQVAVGQVDFADAVLVTGTSDPLERERLGAVLARLAAQAPVAWIDDAVATCESKDAATSDAFVDAVAPGAFEAAVACGPSEDVVAFGAAEVEALLARIPADARRGRIFDAHAPLLRGQPPLGPECGVTLIEFAAARPFHPARLHGALDVLFDGVVTARGRLWLATQPDEVVWLESAGGGLRVGGAGRWLAAMDESELAEVDPQRRALAALRWDERFGDRDISLVILAYDADPVEIREALHWALVEDDELRLVDRAPERVARWDDPFGDWHADPCGDGEPTEAARPRHTRGEGQ
ncbi:ribosome hibernation factor-recruiting GTPase MRF [Nocardia bovistercoris]|uniref:ribosome hibernation factor-recruiting GTPase MRF n=1 Tax=Nocardia bovistercoris TaxID=2785916 RepID=UPI0038CD29F9